MTHLRHSGVRKIQRKRSWETTHFEQCQRYRMISGSVLEHVGESFPILLLTVDTVDKLFLLSDYAIIPRLAYLYHFRLTRVYRKLIIDPRS